MLRKCQGLFQCNFTVREPHMTPAMLRHICHFTKYVLPKGMNISKTAPVHGRGTRVEDRVRGENSLGESW